MKKIYLLAAIAGALTFSSCGDDFLSKDPQGVLNKEALENATGVDLLTIDAYAGLTTWTNTSYSPYQQSPLNWVFGGVYGGDANKGSDPGDQSVLNEVELYNTLTTNGYVEQKWVWVYMESHRVNLALQALAKADDMNDQLKKVREGELRFIKALAYFEGIRVFGPYIPYVPADNEENDPNIKNDKDIYSDVMADIEAAVAQLPETQPEVGRVNAWAAKALKAKMLVYQGKFSEAETLLADVINNGKTSNGLKYGLEDNLNNNFNALTENGKESVFALQYSNAANDTGNAAFCLNYPHNSGPGGCCGFYQPSYELVNSFQVDKDGLPYLNGEYRNLPSVSKRGGKGDPIGVNDKTIAVDPRLDFAVGRYGIPYKDWGLPADDWVRNPVNGGISIPKKHVYSKAEEAAGMKAFMNGWAPGSCMNIEYLSLRDLILLYAECLANDGKTAEAMAQVNIIRERAALPVNIITLPDGTPAANYKIGLYPTSHPAFSDKETCMKAIRMERKLELAMEGERWFDLARWGGDYMSKELKSYVDYEKNYITKFAAASVLSPSKTMLPIPENQIQLKGSEWLIQNDAWK
ncbi:RagB/SusD family nutrient uptake outer membrane protein [Phocaeicola oris]|uniref:RagB/SusD family nutrient uptake outer membrane protein n=1 Tax=Phocaeicola oris TaxID=2896850 RepID=UPI00234ECBA9|nr:RagB/SusD family nutrient uptake outer membrane protein [Phocaeicola oris]MCE2616543.1 RagB/SusD family nutrient uptake outer membrane protein [Phocaeicola oris]